MLGVIYIITNKVNGKQYVGQTIQPLNVRFNRHCQYYSSSSGESKMVIKQAIHKYGRKNFTIEILEECEQQLLDEREMYYINFYDTFNNGYNSTLGGKLGTRNLKLPKSKQLEVCELYQEGFSLRTIANEYNVDHATVKHILQINNLSLRTTRTYKLCQQDRVNILTDINNGLSRKEVMSKYNISKGYLSAIINGKRRI